MTSNARGTVRAGLASLHRFVSAGRGDADSSAAFIGPSRNWHLTISWFWRRRFRFQLPQHVDDFPVAIEFCDFEIIDPIGRDDFHDGDIIVTIENCYLFQLLI